MSLFQLHISVDGLHVTAEYDSVDQALNDNGLYRVLSNHDVVCSVWKGELRITRDVTSWDELKRQLINNSPTLLRG